tara:strand:+ start:334 stop:630 length:297 start_codon:yes stop_codon:yes gene_type:complete
LVEQNTPSGDIDLAQFDVAIAIELIRFYPVFPNSTLSINNDNLVVGIGGARKFVAVITFILKKFITESRYIHDITIIGKIAPEILLLALSPNRDVGKL